MSLEISIKIGDGQGPLSSLGKAARAFSGEGYHQCEHASECDECDLEEECGSCGHCLHCEESCPECGMKGECGSSLGAKAREFGEKENTMGVYDLKKRDLSNEYAPQETTGKRQK